MHKILIFTSLPLFIFAIYFLSRKEESWAVTQYRENIYKDNNGNLMYEDIPVVVTIKHSTHALGFGLAIIGACAFLSGIYFYSKETEKSEGFVTNSAI